MSDNFSFDITGAGLRQCLDIAFIGAPGRKATHWENLPRDDEHPPRLVLFWSKPETHRINAQPFLVPMTPEAVESTVKEWLAAADYGREPDHDGDNSKGWRLYNESWGHALGSHYGFCIIEPTYLWHGK